jgi:hypothetical protein
MIAAANSDEAKPLSQQVLDELLAAMDSLHLVELAMRGAQAESNLDEAAAMRSRSISSGYPRDLAKPTEKSSKCATKPFATRDWSRARSEQSPPGGNRAGCLCNYREISIWLGTVPSAMGARDIIGAGRFCGRPCQPARKS